MICGLFVCASKCKLSNEIILIFFREPPTTMIHWQLDRGLQIETFTDLNLSVASALVGTFDLAEYIKATKNVKMDSFMVCMPAVAVISGTGKLIAKYVAASPGLPFITFHVYSLPISLQMRFRYHLMIFYI